MDGEPINPFNLAAASANGGDWYYGKDKIQKPRISEPRLADAEIIPKCEEVFDKWIFGAIESLSNSENGASLAFVVISCGIEYLTGFWKGGKTKDKDYIAFLESQKWFYEKYSAINIYGSLRCGLVHNFTIHDGKYALTHKNPGNHLKLSDWGQTFLNLENFYEDFKKLKTDLFVSAKSSADAKEKFHKRFRDLGFLIYLDKIPLR